jgi:hypothetical protein
MGAPDSDRQHRRVGVLAATAAAVLVAGLGAQLWFSIHETLDQVSAPARHPLRGFLDRINETMPTNEPFAATSTHVSDAARYVLYPRPRVTPTFTKRGLQSADELYVIVTSAHRPSNLTGEHQWYTVILATPEGRLLQIKDG